MSQYEIFGDVPAFPAPPDSSRDFPGLTKREYFAAIALQGLLSNPNLVEIAQYGDDDDLVFETQGLEAIAVERADALIAELNKAK